VGVMGVGVMGVGVGVGETATGVTVWEESAAMKCHPKIIDNR